MTHAPSTQSHRNADLPTLVDILNDRQARKIDLVVPGTQLRFEDGNLVLKGLEQIMEADGVTDPNGAYHPTRTFDDHLAERLAIHPSYLRRLRAGQFHAKTGKEIAPPRLDLYDANANGLLQGRKAKVRKATDAEVTALETVEDESLSADESGTWWKTLRETIPGDQRDFLVRLFRSDETGRGIARGLLSNRYLRVDDLDGLLAMLAGITEAGVDPDTLHISGDITETRMYVRVLAPEIATLAPELLQGYRSPFDERGSDTKKSGRSFSERAELGARLVAERGWSDRGGMYAGGLNPGRATEETMWRRGEEPIVHAGFRMQNSELGNGRWLIVPEVVVLTCDNGMVMTQEAMARTHVGSKLEVGHMAWSRDTMDKELAWVKAQTRDVVVQALSQDYLEAKVTELTEKATKTVRDGKEEKAIEVVSKQLSFTQSEQEGILKHFLRNGQRTTGGIMQAITSFSQTLDDADAANALDSKAVEALDVLARARL